MSAFGDRKAPRHYAVPRGLRARNQLAWLQDDLRMTREPWGFIGWLAASVPFLAFAILALYSGYDWAGAAILALGALVLVDPLRRTFPWKR